MSSSPYRTTGAQGSAVRSREAFVELETHAGRGRLHSLNGAARPAAGSDYNGLLRRAAAVSTPAEAMSVVDFWREAGPSMWFAKDPGFDRRFRERFLALHEAAARGELDCWIRTADGALALLLLLDQFPRNAFRGTPRMYATDPQARQAAASAIDAGHDQAVPAELRLFFYLPFGHSEDLADQEHAVALARHLAEPNLSHAIGHRDIVLRFGRFPHRNI